MNKLIDDLTDAELAEVHTNHNLQNDCDCEGCREHRLRLDEADERKNDADKSHYSPDRDRLEREAEDRHRDEFED